MQSAGGITAMHIYVWTYVVITFFILLNMFLAIIVDSYVSVKSDTEDARGLVPELISVAHHGLRRLYKSPKYFISDQKLLGHLQKQLAAMSSEQTEAEDKQEIVAIALKSSKSVYLTGGLQVTPKDIAILVGHSGTKSAQVAPDSDLENAVDNAQGGDAIFDVLERYGTDFTSISEKRSTEMQQLFQLENTRRILALHLGQSKMLDEARNISDILKANMSKVPQPRSSLLDLHEEDAPKLTGVQGTLHVTVVKATKLPKMVRC